MGAPALLAGQGAFGSHLGQVWQVAQLQGLQELNVEACALILQYGKVSVLFKRICRQIPVGAVWPLSLAAAEFG